MTHPTGRSFLSYKRERQAEAELLIAALHDVGIPPPMSHSYECEHGHRWEINRFLEAEGARPWNGARPNWNRNTGPE